ncbi:minichromosome maintenance protein MCM [Candidatus Woesearchaeota archaeon]|nr:minichromosome maintenance protein MCM [Candidatus Woesearchaeota archaeon]
MEATLSANDLVARLEDFLRKEYEATILEQARKGERVLHIEFPKLAINDPEVAEYLLEHPEEALRGAEIALESFDAKKFSIRFHKLPESSRIMIRSLRSTHLNKLILIEGVVRQKSDVRPQITNAIFECPSCGHELRVLQLDTKFKEPTKCSCGRKDRFKLVTKELVDAQALTLEEAPEQLDGGEQPKRIRVFLKNDLVSTMAERKTNPGNRIVINGIMKEVPVILRTGGQSTTFDIMLEANSIQSVIEDYTEIKITEEEEKQILDLSQDPQLNQKMLKSIAPGIYGHEKIKEALILQLFGGVRKKREDGVVIRGDTHMLLVGDPGAAKSQLLKRITTVAPKSRYVTGKTTSGAGLSATVVKDEFLQGWSLEAGALVLANNGLCAIDELDKMSKEDAWAMHEALEQQTVTISKANIQATLRCETSVLAAANPKFGRFDPYDTIGNQINLPTTLLSRFDLIFPIKDVPEPKNDERMARFILDLHKNKLEPPEIDTRFLRKYIAYAKQNCKPQLTDEAIEELREYYLKMRSQAGGNRSIGISARQLEGLVRLSEASAKMRLSKKVLKKDARKAIELLDHCLKQVAFDEKTGTIDIDRIATEIPASQRSKIILIKELILDLEKTHGKEIPTETVYKTAQQKGLTESEIDEIINTLKRSGDIYEPRRGTISKV